MRAEPTLGCNTAHLPPMTEPRPILVAVDFSPHSQAALIWALEYGRLLQAPVTVLHVVHDPAAAPGYYAHLEEGETLRLPEHAAKDMLDDFLRQAAEARPDLVVPESYSTQLVIGLPATRIIEVAEQLQAQGIVVGSQGRSVLKRVLLGSKALRVVQLASMPVTVVKRTGFAPVAE